MQCPEDVELLAFADGEIAGDRSARLADHVDACSDCRAVVAEAARRSISEREPTPAVIASSTSPLERGHSVGRYLILHCVGAGGMGVVYAAHDPDIDRTIALKLLRPEVSESASARLLREAQALAKVTHPHVVGVYDVGLFNGQVFMAMEFVQGVTLAEWIEARSPSIRELLRVFLEAGLGLAAAHAAGLVHRDFKPSNVLVQPDGTAKVVDFGLAMTVLGQWGSTTGGKSPEPTPDESARLTATGLLLGTPAYMSPEQRTGQSVDARADQYSFCLAIYEALGGDRDALQRSGSTEEAGSSGSSGALHTVEPRGAARVPRRLLKTLRRGMAPRPEHRFPDMPSLLEALRERSWPARNPWVTAALVAAVLVASVVGLWKSTSEMCHGAARELRKVWGPARRAAVNRALLSTNAPFAAVAAARVSALIERYSQTWSEQHREACEATRLRGEQSEARMDRRMSCLSRRLTELGATVALLARADKTVTERAVKMVSELRRPEVCSADAVISVIMPLPTAPERRARVDALKTRLAELDAARRAGFYAQSIPAAQEAVREARRLNYRPLEAEALALLGLFQEAGGSIKDADATLTAAARAAQAARHDHVYVEVATRLVHLHAYRKRDLARAQAWAANGAAMLERIGGDPTLGGVLHVRVGRLLHHLGRYEEALKRFERGTAMLLSALGPQHLLLAEAYRDHSLTMWWMARYADAERLLTKSKLIQERAHGPDHPEVAHALNGLGLIRWKQGKAEEALQLHRRALSIRERTLSQEHPDITTSLNNLGLVLRHLGRYREAATAYRRALALREKIYGRVHSRVATVLDNLVVVLTEQGRYEEALALNRRSHGVSLQKYGKGHPRLTYNLANRCRILFLLGHLREAVPYCERGVRRMEGIRKDHPDLAIPLVTLGEVRIELGELDAAQKLFERVQALSEGGTGHRRWIVARAIAGLGRIALARRRGKEAAEHLMRALAIPSDVRRDRYHRAVAEFALAKALWLGGSDRARARKFALKAQATLTAERGGRSRELPRVRAWLQRHRL